MVEIQVQGVNQEGKEFCILYELGNKMQLGVCNTMGPTMSSGGPEGKALEKLKTSMAQPFKNNKTKTLYLIKKTAIIV